jgi:hypothetical protein
MKEVYRAWTIKGRARQVIDSLLAIVKCLECCGFVPSQFLGHNVA